jgi:glycine hydroxymethyltransferase
VLKNARKLARELQGRGYRIVSGGTDCHLLSLDLRAKNITGLEAEKALDKAGITVNKNTIPFDPQKPMITSGIRIGSPAVTTRGMKEKQMVLIAGLLDDAIAHKSDEKALKGIKEQVKKLCDGFPMYPGFEN